MKMGEADQIGYILVWEKLKRSFSCLVVLRLVYPEDLCVCGMMLIIIGFLRKICSGDVNLTVLVQGRVQWWVFVITVTNL
jgi:hypothetical protein